MAARLAEAQAGRSEVVLIAGEPGIGKTHLLAEFANFAKGEGWQAWRGWASESEGMPPFLLFTEAFRDYARNAPLEDLCCALEKSGPEVCLLSPDLVRRVPDAPDTSSRTAEERRYRLFESVAEFVAAVADDRRFRGLVLLLDDLHWADQSSLLLLRHVAQRVEERFLLIAAYRSQEADHVGPLADTLAAVHKLRGSREMLLPHLSRDEVGQLMLADCGAVPAAAVVTAVLRETDGNPFFVREIVRQLQASGRDLASADAADSFPQTPTGIQRVVGQRLAGLSAVANRALQAGSVLGEDFSFELLRVLTGVDEATLLDAVEEALAAGIVLEEGGSYRFGHALTRRALYDGLSSARRERLHLRAAEAIEVVYLHNPTRHSAALAAHYRLAGPAAALEKRIASSLRAGDDAQRLLAYHEAEVQWRAALVLASEQGVGREELLPILERLVDLLITLGYDRFAEATELGERALRLYEAAGLEDRAAAMHCRIGTILSTAGATMNILAALAQFESARHALESGPPRAAQLPLFLGLGNVALFAGRTAEGLKHTARAIELAEHLHDDVSRASAMAIRGVHLAFAGSLREAGALLETAWETANRQNQTSACFYATVWGSVYHYLLDDPLGARRWLEREMALPRQLEAPARRRVLTAMNIGYDLWCRDLEAARRLQLEVADWVFEQGAVPLWQPAAAYYAGDWEGAADAWARVHRRYGEMGNRYTQCQFAGRLASARSLQGNAGEAESLLREALAIATEGPLIPQELGARADIGFCLH